MATPAIESPVSEPRAPATRGLRALAAYLLTGIFFGLVLTKGEAVSWFRIQEMFRFESFHMYGILLSAVATAAISLRVLRRLGVRSLDGEPITLPPKDLGGGRRYVAGGAIFGLGWGLAGVCPGPMFALLGDGVGVVSMAIASALVGTWTYGHLRPKLPH